MISDFTKKYPYFAIGGFPLVFKRKRDKFLKKPDNTYRYVYEILAAADSSQYPELLQKRCRISGKGIINDIENPKTFNEKIQWLKLYDSTPMKTLCADKYLVRNWLKEKIGEEYLVPLIGVWDKFDEIDFEALPMRFALKCNHGSGWNCIVEDKNKLDIKHTKALFDEWMNRNYAFVGLELHYKHIPPKIIAEEYLGDEPIKDYRFYCFNGEPKQVWVDLYSGTKKHIRSVFDMDWNKVALKCSWPDGGELLSQKPQNFEKMVHFSRILSKEFCFVRIDFFEIQGKLYMGEMTFTPMSGQGVFEPFEWDLKLGEMLELPKEKYIFKD